MVALARVAGGGDAAAQQIERQRCYLVRVRVRVRCGMKVRVKVPGEGEGVSVSYRTLWSLLARQ